MLEIIIFIQLVAECLPISSSSHVRIAELIMQRFGIMLPELPVHFDHFLHGPMILIVLIFFRREWYSLFKLMVKKWRSTLVQRVMIKLFFFCMFGTLLPVLFLFGLVQPLRDTLFLTSLLTMVGGLVITGVMLMSLVCTITLFFSGIHSEHNAEHQKSVRPERVRCSSAKARRVEWVRTVPSNPSIRASLCYALHRGERLFLNQTILLGLMQAIALLPGISRFASTYVVARWLCIRPQRALQLSFLLEFPLIVAAFFFNGVRGMIKFADWRMFCMPTILASFVLGIIFAYLALCLIAQMVQRQTMWKWSWYLLVPILLMLWLQLF